MTKWTTAIVTATIAMLFAASASAQTKLVQKFKEWVLYSHTGPEANICFLSALPSETRPAGYKRGRSFFYISSWPQSDVTSEVSVKLGNPLQNGSEVTILIGGARYALFSKGDKAFIADPTDEIKLVNSMKRGRTMTVRATTADGTEIEEVYSLSGVTAGINGLSQGCG